MLRIEFEPPNESSRCECCGGITTSLTRFVYEDKDAHAVYYARYSDNHPDGIVTVAISIGDWGQGGQPYDRVAVAVHIKVVGDHFEVMVIEPEASPWHNVAILGRMLGR